MRQVYESNIGEYSFIMNEDDKIEIWRNSDLSSPLLYLEVDPGSIDSEKEFHSEISYWYINNHGN
jgi:hypothetical protein